jgi:hypothetical protein
MRTFRSLVSLALRTASNLPYFELFTVAFTLPVSKVWWLRGVIDCEMVLR